LSVDEKDLEILSLLQEDAKMSAREIGRRTDTPITTIYSRIKKLEETAIIKDYKPILDAGKLGAPTTAFILASFAYRTPRVDEPLEQQHIAAEIADFQGVQEVHIISGNWDILVKVKAKDVTAVGDLILDRLRKVGGIEKTVTCVVFQTAKETLDVPL
jgi:DNA-binding Lrp family transcriptional regulator